MKLHTSFITVVGHLAWYYCLLWHLDRSKTLHLRKLVYFQKVFILVHLFVDYCCRTRNSTYFWHLFVTCDIYSMMVYILFHRVGCYGWWSGSSWILLNQIFFCFMWIPNDHFEILETNFRMEVDILRKNLFFKIIPPLAFIFSWLEFWCYMYYVHCKVCKILRCCAVSS